jgi:hypothetical protein
MENDSARTQKGFEISQEERKRLLRETMAASLKRWHQAATTGKWKGYKAAQDSYSAAVTELAAAEKGTEGTSGVTIRIEGAELAKIEDGSAPTS